MLIFAKRTNKLIEFKKKTKKKQSESYKNVCMY